MQVETIRKLQTILMTRGPEACYNEIENKSYSEEDKRSITFNMLQSIGYEHELFSDDFIKRSKVKDGKRITYPEYRKEVLSNYTFDCVKDVRVFMKTMDEIKMKLLDFYSFRD